MSAEPTAAGSQEPGPDRGWPRWLDTGKSFLRGGFLVGPALAIVLALVVFAAFPWLAPYEPNTIDVGNRLASPDWEHPLGTDDIGRDILSRLIYGARPAVLVAVVSLVIGIGVGLPAGLLAGFQRGKTEGVIMRTVDATMAFPPLVLAIAVVAAMGPGLTNAAIAIGVFFIPLYARLVFALTLTITGEQYILAAQAVGANSLRVMGAHIFPNLVPQVIVQASLAVGVAITSEAALAFLGLGTQPPDASWGVMLRSTVSYMQTHPFASLPAGATIFVVVLAFNILGDAAGDRAYGRGK